MAQTKKKKTAPAEPPLSDEELGEHVRAALTGRALSKADLPKRLGLSSKPDAARALEVARALARQGELYRFAKGASETFYGSDPVSTLDGAVPALLRQQGPLGAVALKQAVKAAVPGHEGFFADWLKTALARRVVYESGPPKTYSPEPPAPDLHKLLAKQLTALQKQIEALEAKGIARELLTAFLRNELGLNLPQAEPTPAPANGRSSREVFLEALRRLAATSPEGALLPVRELRASAGLAKQDFDAAALALSKEGLLVLHHHDHASALSEAEQNALVRDARGRHYVGVALRGVGMTELGALPNPFRDYVVQDAWQSPADVEDIHASAFQALLRGIDSATRGVPDSLLIYGAAGSGKTHLLTRLQRHLAQTALEAPDQVLRCVFVFVRLQTVPQLLWQHVRRRLASDLMRRDQGLTQLQRLIAHQIGVRIGKSPRAAVFRLRVVEGDDQAALAQQLTELTTSLNLPRDLSLVIEHLALNRSVRDASAWLAGESLPESALLALGLGPDLTDDQEQAARNTVTALCRLAGATLPIVFCFDQVEALQRSSDDKEAFFRFGQMAADLHDTDPNVFLVTCLQSAVITLFNDAIRKADYQRMAKHHATLESLSPPQVERLLRSRLDSLPELRALRQAHAAEPSFPFPRGFVAELSADPNTCVPRQLLSRAAHEFEALQQHHVAGRIETSEYLATELFLRQQSAKGGLSPAQTTRLVLQGAELLAKLEGYAVSDHDTARADLIVGGPRRVALSARNEADGRSLGPKLKALLQECPRNDGAQLVIVRDPRLTIAKTAVRTRENLAELQSRGARLVEPTLAALAALEALQSILADAKSGDLANDGAPVLEGSVLAWLRSLKDDISVEPVFELFEAIMTSDAGSAQRPEEQDLAELLSREHALALSTAAERLGHSADVLFAIARQNAERYLVLEGPPIVLLDIAGTSAETGE